MFNALRFYIVFLWRWFLNNTLIRLLNKIRLRPKGKGWLIKVVDRWCYVKLPLELLTFRMGERGEYIWKVEMLHIGEQSYGSQLIARALASYGVQPCEVVTEDHPAIQKFLADLPPLPPELLAAQESAL